MSSAVRAYVAAFLLLLLVLLVIAYLGDPVHGQVPASEAMGTGQRETAERPAMPRMDPRFRRAPEYVGLARVVWKEAGEQATAGEVAAIHEVLVSVTVRKGVPYRTAAWGYSHGVRNPNNASVHNLVEGMTFSTATARYIREGWPRTLQYAREAHEGTSTHECLTADGSQAELVEWGGPDVDRDTIRRLVRRGYVVADCPDTYHNAFLYEVP